MMKMPKVNIVLGRSEVFRRVYANVVRVQQTPTDYRLVFYLDCPREPISEFVADEELKLPEEVIIDRLSQVEVALPLNVAKSLKDILVKNLQQLEESKFTSEDKTRPIYT